MTKAEIELEVEQLRKIWSDQGLIAVTKALFELCSREPFLRYKEIAENQYHLSSWAGPRPNSHWGVGTYDRAGFYDHTFDWTRTIIAHLVDVASDTDVVPKFPTEDDIKNSGQAPENGLIL